MTPGSTLSLSYYNIFHLLYLYELGVGDVGHCLPPHPHATCPTPHHLPPPAPPHTTTRHLPRLPATLPSCILCTHVPQVQCHHLPACTLLPRVLPRAKPVLSRERIVPLCSTFVTTGTPRHLFTVHNRHYARMALEPAVLIRLLCQLYYKAIRRLTSLRRNSLSRYLTAALVPLFACDITGDHQYTCQ